MKIIILLVFFPLTFIGCIFCSSIVNEPMIYDYDGHVNKRSVLDNLKFPLVRYTTSSFLSIQRVDSIRKNISIHVKVKNEFWPSANDLFVVIERKEVAQYTWFKSYPLVKKYVHHSQGFPYSELTHVVDFSDPAFCLCNANGSFRISVLGLLEDVGHSNVVSEHGIRILGRIQSNYIEVTLP